MPCTLRALALVVFAFWAVPAFCDPELAYEPSGDGSSLTLNLTGLDAARTYWVTLVSPDETEGAYGAFQYVSGAEEASLSFAGTPGATEFRLHAQEEGNPLLARLSVATPESDPPEEAGDPATIAFARTYGLSGQWQGSYVCPDGAAEMSMRVWPGIVDELFNGILEVRLTDGDHAGGVGRWPVSIGWSDRNGLGGIAPDTAIEEPFERYGFASVTGARLSEDGLMIEGGTLQRWGCTDFHLERVPAPGAEAADALAASGFSGSWSGSYSCGAATSLQLTFERNPVQGYPTARWVYRTDGGQSGEVVFAAEPSGPGQADLFGLSWVKRPYRHYAAPVALRIAPDGAVIAGEIEGCGAVTLTPDQAAPEDPPQMLSAADVERLIGYEGIWQGMGRCDGVPHFFELEVPDLATGGGEGEFRYIAAEGIDVQSRLRMQVNGEERGNLSLKLLETIVGKLNSDPFVPSRVVPEGDDLRIAFAARACGTAVLSRQVASPVLTVSASQPAGGAVLAMAGDGSVQIAGPEAICAALTDWAAALSPEEARIATAGRMVTDFGTWPALFTDARFGSQFGMPYSDLSTSPDVGRALQAPLRQSCRDLTRGYPGLAKMLEVAFSVGKNSDQLGSDAQKFRAKVAEATETAGEFAEILARVEGLPVEEASIPRLDSVERAASELVGVIAEDRTRLAAAIAAKAEAIRRTSGEGFLTALSEGEAPASLDGLLRAEAILDELSEAERTAWRDRLDSAVSDVVDTLDMSAVAQNRDRLEDLRAYAAVTGALDALDAAEAEADRARRDAILARIDTLRTIPELAPVFADIQSLPSEGTGPLRLAYRDKAAELLADAAPDPAALPAPGEPPVSGGALAGLNRNALITAFLRGDTLVPYRANRESTMIYLQRMAAVFRDYCPAALPPDLPRLIAGEFMDLDALTGSRDQMAAQGLGYILEGLQMMADPGAAMGQAMRRDEIMTMADGDAQILLNNLPCTGTELRTMFQNVRQYVRDPGEGIPVSALRMSDICLRGLDRGGAVMRETRAYCDCAGPELERAPEDLKAYLRADPATHYLQLSYLAPEISQVLRSCRQ